MVCACTRLAAQRIRAKTINGFVALISSSVRTFSSTSSLRIPRLCGERILSLSLSRRIALRHLVEETLFLKLLQKAHIDKLLRLRRLRLRHRRREAIQEKLQTFHCRIGFPRRRADVRLI